MHGESRLFAKEGNAPYLAPMALATEITAVIAAYLMGSVLFGVIAARRAGVDLGEVGSGNLGATNAGRALGPRMGRVVLILDLSKGLIAALGARWLFGFESPWTAACGFAAVFGHCYSGFFRFRGGKGAATGAGVLLAVWPFVGGAALMSFGLLKTLTGKASVGSLGGLLTALAVVTAETVAYERPMAPVWMVVAIAVLVVWRHRSNMKRLWNKEENDA